MFVFAILLSWASFFELVYNSKNEEVEDATKDHEEEGEENEDEEIERELCE